MRSFLLLIIIAALAAGGYIFFIGNKETETETDRDSGNKPVYVQKYDAKDYEGAYAAAKKTIEKEQKPEDPGPYCIAALSGLELGKNQEAETFARTLISLPFRKKPSAQKIALQLGRNFYKRFVSQAEPNKDFWVITRDLLGIGLYAKPKDVNEVIAKIEKLNQTIEFSDEILKGTVRYAIQKGENLRSIGKKFKTNGSMIARINGIENIHVVHAGQTIKIVPGGNYTVIIDKSRFNLTMYRDGIYIKSYRVGIGKEGEETPTGETQITTRQIRPPWTRIGKPAVKYGDPEYPLGERWMSFDKKNFAHYGIHGTDDDSTVGKKSSNGCVRLTNPDVIELYDLITIGTKVIIQE